MCGTMYHQCIPDTYPHFLQIQTVPNSCKWSIQQLFEYVYMNITGQDLGHAVA
jgi:hypothetical protein